jgi:hypothetical protein
MIKVNKLKKAFHDEGLQIPTETINILNNEVKKMVDKWVSNTKKGNIIRLNPDLVWIALGEWGE